MQANPSFAMDGCSCNCNCQILVNVPGPSGATIQQVFYGHGIPDPVTKVFDNMDPTLENIYLDYDGVGVWYPWDVENQTWVVPPEIP